MDFPKPSKNSSRPPDTRDLWDLTIRGLTRHLARLSWRRWGWTGMGREPAKKDVEPEEGDAMVGV